LIDEIAAEYAGSVKVGKINVDEEGALAEQHGVVSIPMLVVYKDGVLEARKNGAAPKNVIVALFKDFI
jgi:thioredoxin 1